MLLKDKLFVVSVIAAVAASFLARHLLDCAMGNIDQCCAYGLTAATTGALRLSGWVSSFLQ
jgi:hypothetical protein